MRIDYSPAFQKRFRLLSLLDKDAVSDTIDFFKDHPYDPSLRNHALEAPMYWKRSISVRDDLRIIFIEKGEYIEVLMLDVGNHNEVYI
jgi:mRNA-degrading endonuclease YafQ of YafQ-DinJ toxin-antitoxin module